MRNTKHQTPNTNKLSNSKVESRGLTYCKVLVDVWKVGVSLVFGVWCLVFFHAS
jgi:hypothetical protein